MFAYARKNKKGETICDICKRFLGYGMQKEWVRCPCHKFGTKEAILRTEGRLMEYNDNIKEATK